MVMFYLFGALAIAASLLVIAQRNPIYSVLLLILSFGALSGLYVLLDAPFVAVIQLTCGVVVQVQPAAVVTVTLLVAPSAGTLLNVAGLT